MLRKILIAFLPLALDAAAITDNGFTYVQGTLPENTNATTALSDHYFLVGKYRASNQLPYVQDLIFQSEEAIENARVKLIDFAKEELAHCYNHIAKNPWGMLVGDLNIDGFSSECVESGLSRLFSIGDFSQATATNYLNDLVTTPINRRNEVKVSYELLDYCIKPKTDRTEGKPTQVLIPLAFPDRPAESLSDHHALLTSWLLD